MNYKELLSTKNIIYSLKTITMIKAKTFSNEMMLIQNNVSLLHGLMHQYNIKINKPIRNVFIAKQELFSSNFLNSSITDNDYVLSFIKNTKGIIINTLNDLNELIHKYCLQFYIFNATLNIFEKITIKSNINFKIDINELNYDILSFIYQKKLNEYAYYMGFANLSLYKVERMRQALDNIKEKCKIAKQLINKQNIEKMNKLNPLLECE